MYTKPLLAVFLISFVHSSLDAQNLPNKQENSIPIPANVKVNGKADEWNNKYQAYNTATELKYTIANNGQYLYIIVRAEEGNIVQKALLQGITTTFSALKNNAGRVSVTYPLENDGKGVFMNPSAKGRDSLVKASNRQLSTQAKQMSLTGVNGIKDEKISIYNEYDIQIAAAIDANNAYTAELLIPLKYIEGTGQSGAVVKYDIQLNAFTKTPDPSVTITQSADGSMTRLSSLRSDGRVTSVSIDTKTYSTMTLPLNFSGEYKLK